MRDDVKILIDNGSIFTACELCPWGCGMEVVIKDGKVTKIKGVKDHPLNRGMLCPKGKAAYAFVTHPDRIAYPMKKVDGKFVQISWDEAFDILKEKLIFIKEKYGAKSFAVAIGMPILLGGNATVSFLRRFWDIYGSPNCFSVESICFRCRIIGYILTFGKFPVADIDHSSCIVLWGNNPTNSNPPAAMRIIKRVKEGAKLIVIDPRRIPLAKKADIHLMIRPGSDCALALSMMNVLINENLYDKEFVDKWCVGFDELKKLVFKYPPEAVEKIAGVDKELIKEAARLFGSIKPACVVQGTNALDQHTTGLQNARAIASLMALTGNIDNKGGFVTTKRVHISPIRLPEKLEGLPLGIDKFPLFYEVWGRVFGEGQAMVLANTILTQKPYPIKALFVAGSNPVLTWPETPKVKKALASLEFVAVMDLFLTDTAKYADLFLP
ncbi:MAG: molybdopterin-dependent oxidoreductase, partial [Deltaproteobacteria bacterium]|nr:molybdopterin-dependent oxidoreductase [Deltaproteobacteria bacterium]